MKVLLVANELYEESVADAARIDAWLDDQLVEVVRPPRFGLDEGFSVGDCDLAVALGGDGTLLRTARLVGGSPTPILGLSYGHLGFLTCGESGANIFETISRALAGELHTSRRSTLEAVIRGHDKDGNEVERRFNALNEVVLSRGGSGRMVEFDVRANGCHIDRLRGDGFIVSTATGSTGYALSAGGPIVSPDFRGLVCVPLAPHTICARAFLTSASDVVELEVAAERSSDRCVFADGETVAPDLEPMSLELRLGENDVILLTSGPEEFYASVSRVFYGKVR